MVTEILEDYLFLFPVLLLGSKQNVVSRGKELYSLSFLIRIVTIPALSIESCLFQGCCSVARSCLTLCDPTDASPPGFPVFTISWSLLKLKSIESVKPSSHFILCCPLLLPPIFPSITVLSHELANYFRVLQVVFFHMLENAFCSPIISLNDCL